ncbi:hypothetical protein [Pseudonocardia sp. WMMC193]|nr:hypothetical protein [Pseudonocardia sp. WMMC193]
MADPPDRLSSESWGADQNVAIAEVRGLPVHRSLAEDPGCARLI